MTFQAGDVIAPAHAPKVLSRVYAVGEAAGQQLVYCYPCRKDGRRHHGRGRAGWSGLSDGYVLIERSRGEHTLRYQAEDRRPVAVVRGGVEV